MAARPTIFLGSSTEQKAVCDALFALLAPAATVKPWTEGVFQPGGTTLGSLLETLSACDFAVFVFAAEDVAIIRHTKQMATRDNVVFELGLAMGLIGPERCYYVFDSSTKVKVPTDLLGITGVGFDRTSAAALKDSMQQAALRIREAVETRQSRVRLPAAQVPAIAEHNALCDELVGSWWEFIRAGERQDISFVTIERNSDTGTITMKGEVYGATGLVLAHWEADAVCVDARNRKLTYLWRGRHENNVEAPFEGFGEMDLRSPQRATGYFSDVNVLDKSTLRKKAAELVRCTERELAEMKDGEARAAAARRRLAKAMAMPTA